MDGLLPINAASVRSIRHRDRQARKARISNALPGLYDNDTEEEEERRPPPSQDRELRTRRSLTDVEVGEVWTENPLVRLGRWLWTYRAQGRKFAVVFGVLLVLLVGVAGARSLYRRFYSLDAYGWDPSRVYRDPHGRLIVDPWRPRMLDPSDDALAWILKDARFWRLRSSQIRLGWGRVLLHGASRSRNVSLSQLEDTLRASGHRCVCAAHAGVPFHALYDRNMDAFMVEPKLGKESSETRTFQVKDALTGQARQLRVPGQLWVDFAEASGTKHISTATGSSVACVVQCSEIVTRNAVVDRSGRVLRDESRFDRDG